MPARRFCPQGDRARVDRVVDGDTVIVDGERVRLIGIDAPESVKPDSPVECFGPEASAALARLLPAAHPWSSSTTMDRLDPYDRILAYVWLHRPPALVNVELVRDGFATVATYPPNVAHLAALEAAEARPGTLTADCGRCPDRHSAMPPGRTDFNYHGADDRRPRTPFRWLSADEQQAWRGWIAAHILLTRRSTVTSRPTTASRWPTTRSSSGSPRLPTASSG